MGVLATEAYNAFMTACKGLTAWQTGRVARMVDQGIDYRGSTKGKIFEYISFHRPSYVMPKILGALSTAKRITKQLTTKQRAALQLLASGRERDFTVLPTQLRNRLVARGYCDFSGPDCEYKLTAKGHQALAEEG